MFSAALLLGSAAPAAADAGLVEMTDGSRVSGDVMAVYVGERVVVRMADGTPTSVPWDRIQRVRDGERVYERDGSVRMEAAPPQPSAPAQVTLTPVPVVTATAVEPATVAVATTGASGDAISRADAVRMVVQVARLPSRGGSAGLIALGGMFLVNGLGLMAANGAWSCDEYGYYDDDDGPCRPRIGIVVGGLLSSGIGVLVITSGARRLRRRKREIQQLIEQNGMLASATPRLELDVDVRADAREGRFVPRLTLAF